MEWAARKYAAIAFDGFRPSRFLGLLERGDKMTAWAPQVFHLRLYVSQTKLTCDFFATWDLFKLVLFEVDAGVTVYNIQASITEKKGYTQATLPKDVDLPAPQEPSGKHRIPPYHTPSAFATRISHTHTTYWRTDEKWGPATKS